MNQCKDCAKWKPFTTHDRERGYCVRKEPVRCCEPVTWADACCPAFEARKDWADTVAAVIEAECCDFTRAEITEMFRAVRG